MINFTIRVLHTLEMTLNECGYDLGHYNRDGNLIDKLCTFNIFEGKDFKSLDEKIDYLNHCSDEELKRINQLFRTKLEERKALNDRKNDEENNLKNKEMSLNEHEQHKISRINRYRELAGLGPDDPITEDNLNKYALFTTSCYCGYALDYLIDEVLGREYGTTAKLGYPDSIMK